MKFSNTRYSFFQILAVIVFAMTASFSFAHNGTIRGMVLDADTKIGLAAATLELTGQNRFATTDELGIFTFSDLPSGTFMIKVSYIGYAGATLEVTVKDHETAAIKIALAPADLHLPNVEISATGTDNLHTISTLDIQTRPVNTAQDILRLVPGLVIAQHAGGGKAEQIFLRGFDIDHGTDIKISVDGMPVNMVSHAHGQGYADLHWAIPELVQDVDFAKGNYDARAGNFATAGHVNFNTANALRQSILKMEAGSFDTWRMMAALDLLGEAAKNKNRNAYIASEYNYTNGPFDSPQAFNRFNLMAKYTGMIGDNQSVSASLSTFTSKWDASGQIPSRALADGNIGRFGAIDDTEGGQTSRTNFNLIFLKNTGGNTFLKNQIYLSRYEFELYSNFTFFLNDPVNGDQIRQKERRNIIGYNGSWNNKTRIGGKELSSEIGLQLRYDEVRDNELSRSKNRRETTARLALGDVDEANAGLYLNETLKLSPRWTLNGGLRYDQFVFAYNDKLDTLYNHQSQQKGIFSPKLNLYFDATPKLRFFANSGIGFHSNDTRVVVAQAGEEVLPKALGLEAGLLVKPFPSLLLHLSAWQLDLEQEFVYVGDEAVVEPSGRTRRKGFDLSARWQLASWLYADGDFNYTLPRARDETEGENFIPLAPTTTSIGGLTAQNKNGLYGSLRYRYVGDRPANEDNSLTAEGQFIIDALLGLKKTKYEFSLSIQNLMDSEFNEAQFDTESRLKNESAPISELHFTPGTPFFVKGSVSYFW